MGVCVLSGCPTHHDYPQQVAYTLPLLTLPCPVLPPPHHPSQVASGRPQAASESIPRAKDVIIESEPVVTAAADEVVEVRFLGLTTLRGLFMVWCSGGEGEGGREGGVWRPHRQRRRRTEVIVLKR